jgi:hypothetical protein
LLYTWTGYSAHAFLADVLSSGADSSVAPVHLVAAYFSDSITTAFNPALATTVDSVEFDGIHLKHNGYYYLDTLSAVSPGAGWQVYRPFPYSSFTYTYPISFANCADFYAMPDTLHQNTAYVRILTATTNLDSAIVFLSDGFKTYGASFSKTNKKILLSIPMMQHFNSGQQLDLFLICTNSYITSYSGTRICLSSNHIYRKKVYLLP